MDSKTRRRRRPNPNASYVSTGPAGKVRGTAVQIRDKYMTLAQDADTLGDKVKSIGCLQYAQHWNTQVKRQ